MARRVLIRKRPRGRLHRLREEWCCRPTWPTSDGIWLRPSPIFSSTFPATRPLPAACRRLRRALPNLRPMLQVRTAQCRHRTASLKEALRHTGSSWQHPMPRRCNNNSTSNSSILSERPCPRPPHPIRLPPWQCTPKSPMAYPPWLSDCIPTNRRAPLRRIRTMSRPRLRS